jgi:hypothetical protein
MSRHRDDERGERQRAAEKAQKTLAHRLEVSEESLARRLRDLHNESSGKDPENEDKSRPT